MCHLTILVSPVWVGHPPIRPLISTYEYRNVKKTVVIAITLSRHDEKKPMPMTGGGLIGPRDFVWDSMLK